MAGDIKLTRLLIAMGFANCRCQLRFYLKLNGDSPDVTLDDCRRQPKNLRCYEPKLIQDLLHAMRQPEFFSPLSICLHVSKMQK